MRIFATLIVMLAIASSVGFAASTVQGMVTDRTAGNAVAAATVRVEGTNIGAITNSKGKFVLKNVPDGLVTIRVSRNDYEAVTTDLILKSGESRDIAITLLSSPGKSTELIVSASKRLQAVQDVPISISTVTSTDLNNRALTRLDDALRYVSGVTVARDQISIRGSSGFAFGVGTRTMVLLDGAPIMSGDNGDVKFDVLPVSDIERMEVIKGAGSALYGTGALGGVVNIITKQPSDTTSASVRLFGGLYDLPKHDSWKYNGATTSSNSGGDVRFARRFGDFSITASGGFRADNSFRDYDTSRRNYGYMSLGYSGFTNWNLRLFAFRAQELKQNFIYWQSLTEATKPQSTINRDENLFSSKLVGGVEATYSPTPTTTMILRPVVMRTRYENQVNDVVQDSNESTAYAYNTEFQITNIVSKKFVVTGGVVARVNDVTSTVYGQEVQTLLSAYGQGEYRIAPLSIVTAGIRIDREETYGLASELQFSPKLGLTHVLNDQFTLRASVGRGFRAPSIAERFATLRYGPFSVKPNGNVKSESSLSSEIGLKYRSTSSSSTLPIEVDLAVFDNELFNMIEPVFDTESPDLPIVFKNITRARVLGSELTVRTFLRSNVGVEFGLTGMYPRDIQNDQPLKFRSNIIFTARASYKPFTWLDAQLEYRGQNRVEAIDDRLAILINNADVRVPTNVVDARLIASLGMITNYPVTLSLIGRNILNYTYTEVPGNLAPTRSMLMQVEYSL